MKEKIIFTNFVGTALDDIIASLDAPQVIVVTDTNTAQLVLPVLAADSGTIAQAHVITVPAGDANKNLDSLTSLWNHLSAIQATRRTVVVNLGGGMVSDLSGFAAASYKRGIKCVNIPTTVLAAVDASVGGKTGINFNGLKNQIGAFSEPEAVIISSIFFNTLPLQEVLSGYAEMIKHGLLESEATLDKLLAYSPVYPEFDSEAILPLIEASVGVKARIVAQDPTEKGLRKALNLGHTIGHAFESYSYVRNSPVAHGYAVAWGLVVELVLSHMQLGFSSETLRKVAVYVHENYGAYEITCKDYPALFEAMRQDKKNSSADQINFTLLEAVGKPRIDCIASEKEIATALDIYRDLMHLA